MTRELDIKVAEAMGWTHQVISTGLAFWFKANGEAVGALPEFRTDYAELPEILAWLEARTYDISIFWSDTARTWHARAIHNQGDNSCHAKDIPEAVARLVVAVAEASK